MANPPGYSEAAPYTSSILSKQRLLELSSPRSSDWLKLLGTLLVDSFSLIMMTALLGNLMRHCMEPTNILCIANNNAQWCNQSSVFMVSSVPLKHRWAARVLVNSDEACIHGQKDIGLPSQVAKFSKTVRAIAKTSETKTSGFLNMVGMFSLDGPKNSMDVQVSEMKGMEEMNICNINFSAPASELESSGWMGPLVKLSLPSFRAVLAVGGPSTTVTSSSILARLSAG
ncbi:protein NEOXANTHIN-DEFICIENT 1-like isoform X7 [Coffea arabica]